MGVEWLRCEEEERDVGGRGRGFGGWCCGNWDGEGKRERRKEEERRIYGWVDEREDRGWYVKEKIRGLKREWRGRMGLG